MLSDDHDESSMKGISMNIISKVNDCKTKEPVFIESLGTRDNLELDRTRVSVITEIGGPLIRYLGLEHRSGVMGPQTEKGGS